MQGFLATQVLFVIVFMSSGSCFEWDAVPEPVVYACAGKTAAFPWSFKTNADDRLADIHWVFDSSFLSQILASLAHGLFLPNPAFAPRLDHVTPAGLIMRDVTMADAGRYTVEVNVVENGVYVTYRHSVHLQVGDDLWIRDSTLRARQDPVASWDDSQGHWVIRLTCGLFTFTGNPPIHVLWTTPSGDTLKSEDYETGHFYLTLSHPVEGGNYTCSIPEQFLPDVCVSNGLHGNEAIAASVLVDEVKVRLTLLEAELRTVKEQNRLLQKEQNDTQEDIADLTHYVDAKDENLTHYVNEVMTNVRLLEVNVSESLGILESDLSLLAYNFNETTKKSRVHFYARNTVKSCYAKDEVVTYRDVVTNTGGHFNATSGVFTVPYNGTYAFFVTVGSWSQTGRYNAQVLLMLDGTQSLTTAFAGDPYPYHWRTGSANAIVHLSSGQVVWPKVSSGDQTVCFWQGRTRFAGFLLSLDP